MTTYRIDPDGFRVVIEGHAGAGEMGSDIVCASISTIVRMLESGVIHAMAEGWLFCQDVRIEDGRAEISCSPIPEKREEMRFLFLCASKMLGLLADAAQEHIRQG